MVPYRSTRTRSSAFNENAPARTRTGQIDHDVFEGLPVRRWSRQPATYSQIPKIENLLDTSTAGGTQKLPELPMPRDSHLLTPTSRALLRAARAGCTYIRPVRKDPEAGGDGTKDGDAAGPSIYDRTFTATKWTTLPRQVDPPEVEFLAKRRVGSTSAYGVTAQGSAIASDGTALAQSPIRKTKFKKVDPATGNIEIYRVLIPGGYKVEGEIPEGTDVNAENPGVTIVTASPTPGSLIEGYGVVDQDGIVVAEPEASMVNVIRKRFPPPKRKAKGVGKGRKKVKFAAGDSVATTGTPSVPTSGTGQGTSAGAEHARPDSRHETEGEDDEDEDEDGDESGEDDESGTESKPAAVMDLTNDLPVPSKDTAPKQEKETAQGSARPVTPSQRDASGSPDIPLATSSTHKHSRASKSPEETKPTSELPQDQSTQPQSTQEQRVSPPGESKIEPTVPDDNPIQSIQEFQQESHQVESHSGAGTGHDEPSQSLPQEGEQMQLDNPLPTTTSPSHTPTLPSTSDIAATTTTSTITSPPIPAPSQPSPPKQTQPEHTNQPSSPKPNQSPVQFEDGEMDLLGSLEASLDRPSQVDAQSEQQRATTSAAQQGEKQPTPSGQDTEMTS